MSESANPDRIAADILIAMLAQRAGRATSANVGPRKEDAELVAEAFRIIRGAVLRRPEPT